MLISPPIDHSSADLAAVRAPARARVVQAILQTDGFTFVEEDRDPNIIASLNLLDLTAAVHEHMHAAAARNFGDDIRENAFALALPSPRVACLLRPRAACRPLRNEQVFLQEVPR